MEYDYARSIGKPIIAFLHGDPGKITAERTESDPQLRNRLTAFREKARRSVVNLYSSPQELAIQVMASMINLVDSKPAVGFVRADQIVDARKYADLLEENQKLRESLNQATSDSQIFPQADTAIDLDVRTWEVDNQGNQIPNSEKLQKCSLSLGVIFIFVSEAIIDGKCRDHYVSDFVLNRIDPSDNWRRRIELGKQHQFVDIKRKLFGNKLIDLEPVEVQRVPGMSAGGGYTLWSLTEHGRSQYRLLTDGDEFF